MSFSVLSMEKSNDLDERKKRRNLGRRRRRGAGNREPFIFDFRDNERDDLHAGNLGSKSRQSDAAKTTNAALAIDRRWIRGLLRRLIHAARRAGFAERTPGLKVGFGIDLRDAASGFGGAFPHSDSPWNGRQGSESESGQEEESTYRSGDHAAPTHANCMEFPHRNEKNRELRLFMGPIPL
jgi:hypothetical protein